MQWTRVLGGWPSSQTSWWLAAHIMLFLWSVSHLSLGGGLLASLPPAIQVLNYCYWPFPCSPTPTPNPAERAPFLWMWLGSGNSSGWRCSITGISGCHGVSRRFEKAEWWARQWQGQGGPWAWGKPKVMIVSAFWTTLGAGGIWACGRNSFKDRRPVQSIGVKSMGCGRGVPGSLRLLGKA